MRAANIVDGRLFSLEEIKIAVQPVIVNQPEVAP